MKLYISLFGADNYAWPRCQTESVIVTITDHDLFPFWAARDREGFIEYAVKKKKTQRGNIPNRQTASRWYGLIQNVVETEGDYWLHRSGDEIWWTVSGAAPADYVEEHDPSGARTFVFRKQCAPWSNKDLKGRPLRWSALHPKARNILSTQSTQITLSGENKSYTESLLTGQSLEAWHDAKDWREALMKVGAGVGKTFSARERAIWRMVASVKNTVVSSNGQVVERVVKNKDLLITEDELSKLLDELIDDQEGMCAISDIPLQLDGEETDKQMLCSLDRIDSSGHYERGNLQLVCRFINKWKSADEDYEFRRLLKIVRSTSVSATEKTS